MEPNRWTLIQTIMSTHEALTNCARSGNTEWHAKHTATLQQLYSMLPSGSGIDNGTTVVTISRERLVLSCGFHHMNANGFYDGWTEHRIRVTPSWTGITVHVYGRDRNDILEDLHETYYSTLTATVAYDAESGRYHFAR